MTLKVVHTKDGRTLYKDLDTGHWVPKDKAVAHLKQKERDDHNRTVKQDEDLKAEQIRKQQEEAKRLNDQSLTDSEPYKDILGPRKHIDNPAKRAEECHKEYIINSKYYDDKEEYYKYHKNCALCSTAVALQGMGYDVEAMPKEKNHWRGFGHIFDVDYSNTDNYIIGGSKHWATGHPRYRSGSQEVAVRADENDLVKSFKPNKQPDFMPKGAKEAATMITEKVKGWGNGAIGEMSVSWKDSSKWHSVALLNVDGVVKIFDAQDSSITTDIEKFLKDTYASRTSIVRLDNAKLRKDCQDDMKKMVKQVDRSFAAAMKRVDILPNSLGLFKK